MKSAGAEGRDPRCGAAGLAAGFAPAARACPLPAAGGTAAGARGPWLPGEFPGLEYSRPLCETALSMGMLQLENFLRGNNGADTWGMLHSSSFWYIANLGKGK